MTTAFPDVDTRQSVDVTSEPAKPYVVVVYDDNVNTFAGVIYALLKYCKVSKEKAEQLTWTIHTDGKATVYHGDREECTVIAQALCRKQINAKVEEG